MRKLLFFWNELRATFWFFPVIIILFSVLLAIGFITLDAVVSLSQEGLGRYFFVNSVDAARSILSTVSGAMIGVAGTVFSVTLVVLTLASSQLGPRLIKNFMYIRLNQIVLGSYISTYLYCLIVLNAIKETSDYSFVPSLSILFALLAAVANILLLIVFIHHTAVSIQADKVIADISAFISRQVTVLFPEKMGNEISESVDFSVDKIKSAFPVIVSVKSPGSGYFQYLDSQKLLTTVSNADALFELFYRPGDYLVAGMEIGKLFLKDNSGENLVDKISFLFVIGRTKTAHQDLEFSIHQMVEIAMRALSPGVNDPYTAIACIDNLTATLCYLAQVEFPSKYRMDEQQQLRIIANRLDFEGVLNAAFLQIRQFSLGSPAVIIRLMEVLTIIHEFALKPEHKKAVIRHAKMTLFIGKESISDKNDLDDLIERARQLIGE
ncbi:MAG: DUF2254 domain-containing protein [Bacteroidia bacterium]|nr:DUF2254 domain-containing protein [Bacteroidia bacterium]